MKTKEIVKKIFSFLGNVLSLGLKIYIQNKMKQKNCK